MTLILEIFMWDDGTTLASVLLLSKRSSDTQTKRSVHLVFCFTIYLAYLYEIDELYPRLHYHCVVVASAGICFRFETETYCFETETYRENRNLKVKPNLLTETDSRAAAPKRPAAPSEHCDKPRKLRGI